MKKLFFLTALLCASVMAFAAIDWNNYEWLGDGAGGGAYSNKYKIALASGQAVVNIQKPGFADEAGIYTTFPAGIISCTLADGQYAVQGAGAVLYLSAFTKQETEVTVVHGTGTCVFTVYYVDGEASSSGKADPELSLNKTADTLSAESPAETFQIIPTKKGNGAISYSSNNSGIASVSETGLVTAVGRGIARITVSLAETDDYADAVATLVVTVTGPINWDAISWLSGSNDKYKLVIDPDIDNKFGGKKIEGENLWVGFPSAVFGECSIEYSALGAGVSFALSNFPQKTKNQFTMVCEGITYTFYVYNDNGTDSATAIENVEVGAKAIKIFENGQLIIIKNGVRYSALGNEIK